MSQVTLVFDDGDGRTEVECDRVQVLAADVTPGDFVACPFVGMIHVHANRAVGKIHYLEDCRGHEHLYRAKDLLDVARPTSIDDRFDGGH